MPREPKDRRGWLKATDRDLSRAIRLEASDFNGIAQCVTCGKHAPWKELQAGHFLAGRCESIRYIEIGIHPQCGICNCTGMTRSFDRTRQKTEQVAHAYLEYMLDIYGEPVVEALRRLKSEPRTHTVPELRVMRKHYQWRAKEAAKARNITI